MRVNVSAAAGAAIAALLAAVSHARHPAQVVVPIAAGCAFMALLTRRSQVAPSDWFTVRVLLAGNLVVFGVSYAHQFGVALAVSAALFGLALLVIAIWSRVLERRRQEPDHAEQQDPAAKPAPPDRDRRGRQHGARGAVMRIQGPSS